MAQIPAASAPANAATRACRCACGVVQYRTRGRPLLRGYCHCTLCQAFNQAPFADITVFHRDDVEMPPEDQIAYRTLRPPPAVQRGACRVCGRPAVEYLSLPLMPTLVVVPTANIADAEGLPLPALHIFYNRRQADVEDALPKFSGYLRSQVAFMSRVVSALVRRPRQGARDATTT